MDKDLHRYLHFHLAGSIAAVQLIGHFVDTLDRPEAREFFVDLKGKVEKDQELLRHLLVSAGMDLSAPVIHAGGDIAGRISFLKFAWDGFEPGRLGFFEALEMLALGIQGKRLLWLALKEIAGWYPEWKDVDFSQLELAAITQRDGVELWRIEAARDTLPDIRRRVVEPACA